MEINSSRLRLIMAEKGLTKKELADRCCLNRQNILTILRRGTCSPKSLRKLASGLGVSEIELRRDSDTLTLDELMNMDGEPVFLAVDRKWYIVSVNYETHQFKQPCGVDKWGAGTSLSLLARCGVYRRPPKEEAH